MARSLVLSNGNVLVCYDEWGQVRDFYFPRVGLENHVGDKLMQRIGVMVDREMHWFSESDFTFSIDYAHEALVSKIKVTSDSLKLSFLFEDVVYNEHDIYVRAVQVHNDATRDREVKLFFNQQFHISENKHGDTAYYSPELKALVHYKGRRVFIISARCGGDYFDDYGVGLLGIEGHEGTWKDAEDGQLSKSGIEHGSVDSVLGLTLQLPSQGTKIVEYWISAGRTYRRAERIHRDIVTRTPEHLIRTTTNFWRAWVNRTDITDCGMKPELVELYKRSLLTMRSHTDNRGAIIASGDSSILQSGRDTYTYCWPRDGGFIVLAYIRAGHMAASGHFHEFCNDVLTDDGYLLHKYRPDRSLGSSWHPWVQNGRAQPPIQEDETAITLISLHEHYQLSRDVEMIERMYNPYIKRAADFLARYRDKKTGLPLPSHDLWEEQFGTFTYTSSTVYAALKAAAQFAKLLGKEVARTRWESAAEDIRDGILTTLVHEDGRAMKSLRYKTHSPEPDYTTDASSFYGLFRFGVLPVGDRRLELIYERTKEKLTITNGIGGVARYEGDNYFRATHDVTGNPWVITTLWLTEYEIQKARSVKDLADPIQGLEWVLARTNEAGLLSEQYHPHSGVPMSASPLIWSHAQYVLTFHAYVDKLTELKVCKA
jgi:glucoamylase